MPPFDWNERLRQLGREQAEAAKIKKDSLEHAKRWQSAWETAEADALAQQQRAQDAEREKRLSEEKLKAEQQARLELERDVEAVVEQLAEPLGAHAPTKGSILERLRSAAVGVADLLRQQTARAEKAEKRVNGLEKYLRHFLKLVKKRLPGERGFLEKEELRILGEAKPGSSETDAKDTVSPEDALVKGAATMQTDASPPPAPAKPEKHFSTEKYRKRSAAVTPLLWTPPDRQVARPGDSEHTKAKDPAEVQPTPVRERAGDVHER